MAELFDRLKDYGHKTVGYVSTIDRLLFRYDERGKAFREGVRRCGMCQDEDLVEFNEEHAVLSENVGYEGLKRLLERRSDVTAVFCTNDMAAIGAIRAARDLKLRVPEDLSVIGCDDINLASMTTPG